MVNKSQSVHWAYFFSTASCLLIIILGSLGIAGWLIHSDVLVSVLPGLATMKFNTGLCFVLLASGGLVMVFGHHQKLCGKIALGLSLLAVLVAGLTLVEYLGNIDLGIDQAVIVDDRSMHAEFPGRMSLATAVGFILAGAGVGLLVTGRTKAGQGCALALTLFGLFAISGYAYGLQDFYALSAFSSMALNTSVSFLLLGLSLLAVRADEGWVYEALESTGDGLKAWQAGLLLVLVALGAGGVVERLEAAGYIGSRLDTALMVGITTVVTCGIFLFSAQRIHEQRLDSLANERTVLRLREALDAHAIVAITDPSGSITYVNDKFCEISQYSREELLGRNHRIINSGFHPKSFFRELWTTIGRGEVWHGQICNRAKDGSLYWVATTIVPFLNEAGKPIEYVAIRADITALKDAEAEILQLNTELEERVRNRTIDLEAANKELQAFSYAVSHDLRAPLRAISGFTQIIEEAYGEKLDDAGRDYCQRVIKGTDRMGVLIDELLKLSRLARAPFEPAEVNVTELMEDVVRGLRDAYPERTGDFIIQPGLHAVADPGLLRIALENLLGNAWKFSAKNGNARIECGKQIGEDETPVFFVKDNGVGFDMEYAGKLFSPFQRLHRADEFEGTGIGLAIVQRVINRHGGRIWAESVPGVGSTFYFNLNPGGDA